MLRNIFRRYRHIESHVKNIIIAQFFLQSVNTAYFLLLNYYLVDAGYEDYEVAEILAYRFFAVGLLAFPMGLFIKGRNLKPFFIAATLIVPIFSNLLLFCVEYGWESLLYWTVGIWGIGYACIQITILPYIILNAKPDYHSEAISLSFLSFSVTICLVGIGNFILNYIAPDFFDERMVLTIISTLAFAGFYFVIKTNVQENISHKIPFNRILKDYDWRVIFQAIIPTTIIAIGAGFTIPVISLFFLKVHGLPSNIFSIIGAFTFLLVAGTMLFMPYIKRRFGYRIAITLFQSLAVLALFLLATTEYYSQYSFAVYVAIIFYMVRQPLMSAASPMTSELMLYYVGKRNQEIIAALNASIWAGSWFVSMKIFQWLRQMELRYVSIFLITVALYVVGVTWYAYLIRTYERRTAAEAKQLEAVEH